MDTKLNEAARELLEQLADRLPKRRLPAYRALADAGETAQLLNELCKILIGRGTAVTPAEKATLTQLLDTVPAGDYDYINNRDQTLAAIQVAEQPQATTHDDLRALSAGTHALLERLADRLPQDRLEEYRTLSRVGEWSMLVDLLSASLVTRRIPISPSERDALAALLNWFRPAAVADLAYVRDRENTLAALNVTDQP
ncbi:hypothetical protein SAMN05421805_102250 [Saccharopolyspora antimicrobica]|uniref:Uncharacterized protein n=1 Tax=Saccharopolyspora antimicrobica TaxID=455193 RepID=A0A1I4VK90_9PSEU|nr:hypothetical protein [Saccharopolyspora antimicrobica]RKT86354.1 hypothetical protein ATL45_4719 [Saccharopolyspora antimicrobica]SFN01652.1 hypothetical protein SAMN05421805_102250 [Saccharopolyspora antimicrobica]